MNNDMPEWVPAWLIVKHCGLSIEKIEDTLKARLPEKIFRVPEFWEKWTEKFWLERYPAERTNADWRQNAINGRDELLKLDSRESFDKLEDLLIAALPENNVFTSDNINLRLGEFVADTIKEVYRGQLTDTAQAALRIIPNWALPSLYCKHGNDDEDYELNSHNIYDIFFDVFKSIFIESLFIKKEELRLILTIEELNSLRALAQREISIDDFDDKDKKTIPKWPKTDKKQIEQTLRENRKAVDYVNQQRAKRVSDKEIFDALKSKNFSIAVIGVLLLGEEAADTKEATECGKNFRGGKQSSKKKSSSKESL